MELGVEEFDILRVGVVDFLKKCYLDLELVPDLL